MFLSGSRKIRGKLRSKETGIARRRRHICRVLSTKARDHHFFAVELAWCMERPLDAFALQQRQVQPGGCQAQAGRGKQVTLITRRQCQAPDRSMLTCNCPPLTTQQTDMMQEVMFHDEREDRTDLSDHQSM